MATENDPQRVARLARLRWPTEPWQAQERLVLADARDRHLLPKVGAAWRPTGRQEEVMTPGQHEKHALAGALDLTTGKIFPCRGTRKTHACLRDRLPLRERTSAPPQGSRLDVVVANSRRHKAKAVGQWGATQPRFAWLWLPTACPRANPRERAFGDVHDQGTRHHKRKRLRDVVGDVAQHLHATGPWVYTLARIYQEPEIPAAVERIAAEAQPQRAA